MVTKEHYEQIATALDKCCGLASEIRDYRTLLVLSITRHGYRAHKPMLLQWLCDQIKRLGLERQLTPRPISRQEEALLRGLEAVSDIAGDAVRDCQAIAAAAAITAYLGLLLAQQDHARLGRLTDVVSETAFGIGFVDSLHIYQSAVSFTEPANRN